MEHTPQKLTIKAATRSLIGSCGGQEAAEMSCRVSRSTLSLAGDNGKAQFLPADAVVDLTISTKNYGLLQLMCRQAGLETPLPRTPESNASETDVLLTASSAHTASSQSTGVTLEALADANLSNEELQVMHKNGIESLIAAHSHVGAIEKIARDRGGTTPS